MKSNPSFLSRIFNNKLFLIILSVLISLIIWLGINLGDTAETSYIVKDIPITINLPEEAQNQGLEIFNNADLVGSVTVSGNRSVIGRLDANDIQIVPEQTDSLTSAGSYTLSLVAKKTGSLSNYTIESVTPSVAYIKLDRTREITQKISTNLIDYKIPSGYYGNIFLSQDTVTISGPESEIKQIDQVVIEGTIEDELTESLKDKYKIKLLDSFGEEIADSDTINISPSEVTATISVLKMKNVNVILNTKNAPTGVDLSQYATIDPEKVSVAGETANIENVTQVRTSAIDFSTLKNAKYSLTQDLEIPDKCIDINSINTVNVDIDLTGMKSKTITISDFDIKGLDSAYSGEVTTSSQSITVYGTEKQIKKLTKDNISAVVDLTNTKVSTGSKEMPLTVTLNDINGCWVYGSYKAVVEISE
jgi:YbbR domain-containing protein